MFKLSVSDESHRATFYCEFCREEYKWPFDARTLWKGQANEQSYPDVRHVILSHFIGDLNLTRLGFSECPDRGKWHDTAWQWIDEDSGAIQRSGSVRMHHDWPYVTNSY